MIDKNFTQNLRKQLTEDKLPLVLQEVLPILENQLEQNLLGLAQEFRLQAGLLHDAQKAFTSGFLTYEQYHTLLARRRAALLDLINQLDHVHISGESVPQANTSYPSAKPIERSHIEHPVMQTLLDAGYCSLSLPRTDMRPLHILMIDAGKFDNLGGSTLRDIFSQGDIVAYPAVRKELRTMAGQNLIAQEVKLTAIDSYINDAEINEKLRTFSEKLKKSEIYIIYDTLSLHHTEEVIALRAIRLLYDKKSWFQFWDKGKANFRIKSVSGVLVRDESEFPVETLAGNIELY